MTNIYHHYSFSGPTLVAGGIPLYTTDHVCENNLNQTETNNRQIVL